MLPFISYNFVVKKLTINNQEFKEILKLLGDLETASAVLNYRKIMPNTIRPVFSKDFKVYGKDVYHPLLTEPTSNDVDWKKYVSNWIKCIWKINLCKKRCNIMYPFFIYQYRTISTISITVCTCNDFNEYFR